MFSPQEGWASLRSMKDISFPIRMSFFWFFPSYDKDQMHLIEQTIHMHGISSQRVMIIDFKGKYVLLESAPILPHRNCG